MEIRLSAHTAAVIEREIATGRFTSVEEYIDAAVELFHEREGWREETAEELNASLEAAIAEAERDGWLDEAEVQLRMSRVKAEWPTGRPA